ncbi:MAG: class I SAM-dependent methyltransferase [Bacteroidota bacterium]
MDQNPAVFQGKRAQGYDDFIEHWMPNYKEFMQDIPSLLAKGLTAQEAALLIVGSGTGNEIQQIAKEQPSWYLVGIDPSPEMVDIARRKLAGHPQVRLHRGYVGDLPLDTLFDGATLILVLHFLPDDGSKLRLLQDIAQRLKSGSMLLFTGIFGTPEQLQAGLEALRPKLITYQPAEEVDRRIQTLPQRIHHVSEERLQALFTEAGFTEWTPIFRHTIYGAWTCKKD